MLHTELSAEQRTCQELRARLDDERRSDRRSSTGLIGRLLGRRPDPGAPPSPQAAAVAAELAAHERAMQRLSAEFATAQKESAGLDEARQRLESAVAARSAAVAGSGDERGRRLVALDDELAVARRTRDTVRGAHHSAIRALGALETAIDRLGSAEAWSAADFLSDGSGGFRHGSARFGGDVAGRAKHDALDRSVVPVAEAHAALLSLRSELADLGRPTDDVHRPNIRMPSSGLTTWDIWFDNEFSDLMVHDRISSSITELERSRTGIERLIAELTPPAESADAAVADLEARRAHLLRTDAP